MSEIYLSAESIMLNGEEIGKITIPEYQARYELESVFGYSEKEIEEKANEAFEDGKREGLTEGHADVSDWLDDTIDRGFDDIEREFEGMSGPQRKLLDAVFKMVTESLEDAKEKFE